LSKSVKRIVRNGGEWTGDEEVAVIGAGVEGDASEEVAEGDASEETAEGDASEETAEGDVTEENVEEAAEEAS